MSAYINIERGREKTEHNTQTQRQNRGTAHRFHKTVRQKEIVGSEGEEKTLILFF